MIIYLYIFVLGAIMASFALLVADRIPKSLSIIHGRSHCEYCHHRLEWYDLIPIISYLSLKGKCRYCHQHLSLIYPISELFGGLIALLCFKRFGIDLKTITSFVIILILFIIGIIDYRYMDIYNSTQYALLIIGSIHRILTPTNILSMIISIFLISGIMMLMNLIIKDGFGMGDIELMAIVGIFLSPSLNIIAALIGVILAGISCLIMMIFKKIKDNIHIAFAPYLSIGIAISLLYGEMILDWYLNIFL